MRKPVSLFNRSCASALCLAFSGFFAVVADPAQADEVPRTITVDVPANTPGEDTVYLQSGAVIMWPMTRVDEDTWTLTLHESDLVNPAYGSEEAYRGPWYAKDSETLFYAYTRGFDYIGAEALAEEPYQWFGKRQGVVKPGATLHDEVTRWRWMPADGVTLPTYAPTLKTWKPRLDGLEFQAGVMETDYWFDVLKPVVGPTTLAAKHAAIATWVELAPSWGYAQVDPLPILSNLDEADGRVEEGRYSEADLRTHIRESKARGLKVLLQPQICCNGPNGQTLGEAWYRQWFDQYEAFLLNHARIAAEEGVDSIGIESRDAAHVSALPGYQPAFPWFEQRWRELMAHVRAVYHGPIGYAGGLIRPVDDTPGNAWGYLDSKPILDLFDYFGVFMWAGLAVGNDDTQAQITARVQKLFDSEIRPIFEDTGKPFILTQVAYGSYDGAARNYMTDVDLAVTYYHPEKDNTLADDPIEQAMVYQAIMQAVADRPYIIGVYPFGYSYLSLPLSPDHSIRGKAAEGVLAAWYAHAKEDVPVELEAGHSGAFKNPLRTGEGSYIEILGDGRVLVYTFSYRPDGTGPAWFLGVGDIVGDSIVIEDLLRPTGTRFGAGFNSEDIDFSQAGAMSISFPDCKAAGNGGSVVFSGSPALGYESLLTRAARISQITGCGEPAANNAGLSGSFKDLARNGEGIVVEWLTNGQVLVIFFTYDLDGNQYWVLGVAPPDGKSVTMEALYPSAWSRWGSQFDPDEVELSTWGDFTLTWTSCNELTFAYHSDLPGFGSATRNYTRITNLAGTSCPAFP